MRIEITKLRLTLTPVFQSTLHMCGKAVIQSKKMAKAVLLIDEPHDVFP